MPFHWICALCLLLGLSARATSPVFWKAEPRNSRLEILTPTGGWETSGEKELRLKVVDLTDPRPAVDRSLDYWEQWQTRRKAEEEAVRFCALQQVAGDPPIRAQRREEIWTWLQDGESEKGPITPAELSFTSRWLKALAGARQQLADAEQSRKRTLQAWFNGEALTWNVEVNREQAFTVNSIQGENRLEILDSATGQTQVRTWWYGGRSPRLRVTAREQGVRWSSWDLEVMEPGGKLVSGVQDFEKSHPASGTYSLRWNAGAASQWWSPEDAQPRLLRVDVMLDGGTDKERRWRFEVLILPGTGRVQIGSFDVED
ncbi:MAG: hypothetical protein Q8O00_06265 [Holophaga sp.]|nr:hypothetical protein [Holophaga sp.]